MRRNQSRKRCVGSQKMQSALLTWRGEQEVLLMPSLIRAPCGVNTRNSADLGSCAVHSRSAGVCRGWLCKLIDNLTGSDKTLARVHGAAIRAYHCQHDVVVQEDPMKFTLPFFWAVVCFNKQQTHMQDCLWAVNTHFGVHVRVCQRWSRPCWALQLFHFLPVPSYYGYSKEELRYHQTDWAAKIIFISTSLSICLL